jgi:hypothetical protein
MPRKSAQGEGERIPATGKSWRSWWESNTPSTERQKARNTRALSFNRWIGAMGKADEDIHPSSLAKVCDAGHIQSQLLFYS